MKNIVYLHAGAELYGADIVLLELIKKIDKKSFNPIVILPNKGPLVGEIKKLGVDVRVVDYPILRRKYFNLAGIINYAINYFKSLKKIIALLEMDNIKVDIIHVNTLAVLEGIILKRKLKSKMIWHVHEIIEKPRAINKILTMLLGKFSDRIVTVSKAVQTHLNSSGNFSEGQVKVIYNGIDMQKFSRDKDTSYLREEFNIPQDAMVVGMIGRVNAWKGQEDFLKAAEILLKETKNTYFVLVGGVFQGEEWRFDNLNSYIENMKYKDKVRFINYRADTPNFHALYDIFVLPSTSPDPLPTVVLEAMASQTPIVGYRHGGVCEMVSEEENGLLADVRDTVDLADKIKSLLYDNELRESYSINSENRVKTLFSLEAYIKNFEELYFEVL